MFVFCSASNIVTPSFLFISATISNLLASERGEVTKGSVTYSNEYIHDLDPAQLVKKGVIQVMEGRHCFEHLTVEENLLTGAYTRTNNKEVKEDLERVYGYFPRLRDRRTSLAGYTSGGEQQMIACLLYTSPSPRDSCASRMPSSA